MRKIKAQKLTKEAFAPFGTYYDVLKPEGAHLGDFYQDHVTDPVAFGVPMGFSALVAHKAEKMIVKGSEYHNYTGEVMIPLDGDVIIYVAPVSKEPVPQETKAFHRPAGNGGAPGNGSLASGAVPGFEGRGPSAAGSSAENVCQ
jgi:ureidoglycolate lyase